MSLAQNLQWLAGEETLEVYLARVREEQAALARPGTEKEKAWHAIVPSEFRECGRPHSHPADNPEIEINPS